MKEKAAIVGAGIGGLAAALRLTKLNYEVTVFESASKAGGKINEFRKQGFRFDMGPSLFTLPQMVDDLFRLFDKDPLQYLQYKQLDLITKYFYPDGLTLNAYSNVPEFAQEISNKTEVTAQQVKAYLKLSEEVYHLTADNFIFKPFTLNTLRSKSFWKAALKINKLNVDKTMHQLNESFFADARVTQLFDRYATYNGSNPYETPGTLSVISHLEHNTGAYFPEKGMYQIVEALQRLAEEQGVTFRFSEAVQEITTSQRKVEGLVTGKGHYPFDLVVSDADIFSVYGNLLPDEPVPQSQKKQERSSSALIFYWAIDKLHPQLDLHNVLFSSDYAKEFHELFQLKCLPEDPTVYLFISSKAVAGDAPKGKENWFVMINAPAGDNIEWEKEIPEARKRIIAKINAMLNTDIEPKILFERRLDPPAIEKNTGSYRGSLYGNSSNSKFSAFLRHRNHSRKYNNLYFVGGSVHPGGGIPLCLSSAKIMYDQLLNHQSS